MNQFPSKVFFAIVLLLWSVNTLVTAQASTTVSVNDSAIVIVIQKSDSAGILFLDSLGTLLNREPPAAAESPKEKKEEVGPESILEVFSASKILWSLIFLVVTYFIVRLITNLLSVFAERSAAYRITLKGFIPVFRVLGWFLAIYVIVQGIIRPPVETLIALMASLGIAIGFASQDFFKNFFGGLMVIFDQPFKVGDKIEVGQYYGEVIEIGLRSTRIVTPDDSVVSVPNGELMNQSVSNANTGAADCQVVAEIFLPLSIPTEQVRKIAVEAAQVSKYVYLNKPIQVLFINEINENRSYYKMRLKAYVVDIRNEFAFKSDMTELVLKALIDKGIIEPGEMWE